MPDTLSPEATAALETVPENLRPFCSYDDAQAAVIVPYTALEELYPGDAKHLVLAAIRPRVGVVRAGDPNGVKD